jgi:hypothetical protein
MIVTLALFPLSIPLISCPVTGALILLLMSPAVILYSIHGNSVQHTIQIQDYVLTSVSSACVALYFLLVGSTILVTRLETYFGTFPWLTLWEKSTKKCPFTGLSVFFVYNVYYMYYIYPMCYRLPSEQEMPQLWVPRQ